MSTYSKRFIALTGVVLALGLFAADAAEARRGGSFGSRGARTYQAPRPTRTAPEQTAPVQKSMTEKDAQAQQPGAASARPATAQQPQAPRRGGFLGGLGGGLLGGMMLGGLVGMLMGHGIGAGMTGMMSLLFQIGLVALVAWLAMRFFRRREPQAAYAGSGRSANVHPFQPNAEPFRPAATYMPLTPAAETIEFDVSEADRADFEKLLGEVQTAFTREDYARLREVCTPEIVSYLSEELSQNATQGLRNEVTDLRLVQADVAEAWREGDSDYATAAMRYEAIDVMRDRTSGKVVGGDERPTQTTELWTFVRKPGAPWKLSAIQEA
jgi:predicted lipid-binding transport protein (Tim44 family)